MTKRTQFVAASAILMLGAATLSAGSIDAKSNLSTGYLRNPSGTPRIPVRRPRSTTWPEPAS